MPVRSAMKIQSTATSQASSQASSQSFQLNINVPRVLFLILVCLFCYNMYAEYNIALEETNSIKEWNQCLTSFINLSCLAKKDDACFELRVCLESGIQDDFENLLMISIIKATKSLQYLSMPLLLLIGYAILKKN